MTPAAGESPWLAIGIPTLQDPTLCSTFHAALRSLTVLHHLEGARAFDAFSKISSVRFADHGTSAAIIHDLTESLLSALGNVTLRTRVRFCQLWTLFVRADLILVGLRATGQLDAAQAHVASVANSMQAWEKAYSRDRSREYRELVDALMGQFVGEGAEERAEWVAFHQSLCWGDLGPDPDAQGGGGGSESSPPLN